MSNSWYRSCSIAYFLGIVISIANEVLIEKEEKSSQELVAAVRMLEIEV